LLLDNLYNESLRPQSQPWRESKFRLGKLLFIQGNLAEAKSRINGVDALDPDVRRTALRDLEQAARSYEESIQHLEEAVARWPTDGRSVNARYLVAEAFRKSARLPRMMLPIEPTETRKNALREQERRLLESAATTHHELQLHLSELQEKTELTPQELRTLRNTYFGYADALFNLERYPEAIKAYSAATNRYQHEPECLEAFLQIANCYRQLHATTEARGTLLQAKAVLQRIRPDANFTATTRFNRDDWGKLIDWLAQL